MSGWAGFSDSELRKFQQNSDSVVPVSLGRGRKPVTRSRQQLQREQALAQSKSGPDPRPEPRPGTEPETRAETNGAENMSGLKNPAEEPETTPVLKELEKQEVEVRERSRLEQLQMEQKEMEEKNKRKKALLTRTIAQKSKQTRAESLKLQKIQKELQTLDDMVSNDISILRGRIEQASWDYSCARKRYEKAESEFVTSKLELHKKTEVKEQLTEHLCAIIQQNELRKALKLEELMSRLEMTTQEEQEAQEEQEREEKEEKEREEKEATEEPGPGGQDQNQLHKAQEEEEVSRLERTTQEEEEVGPGDQEEPKEEADPGGQEQTQEVNVTSQASSDPDPQS
uniref:RAB6-interacting golgin n=1 Tax=Knipowitschia caucasica TaxID=637954 RepID=A0AAV2KSR4_KNICA